MPENRKPTAQDLTHLDEIPDLATPEWEASFAKARVKPGRPKSANPKVSTTLRLDPDLLDALRATGKGWQSRANELLRKGMGL